MKKLCMLLCLVLAFAPSAFAGKGARGDKHRFAIAKFDANGNHQIDGDEIAKLKTAFEKAPADGKAKHRIDQNNNGVLDDAELAALNKHLAKRAQKAGKHPKKKAA